MATPEKTNHYNPNDTDDDVADPALARLTDDDIPMERAPVEGEALDPAKTLRELLGFHLYGRRPEGQESSGKHSSLPALLYRYRDLSLIRHDYPVCLIDEPEESAKTLTEIMDGVQGAVAGDGDQGEQMKRDVYRIESAVRSAIQRKPGQRLTVVWEEAVESLTSASDLSADSRKRLMDNLSTAREALAVDGDLVSCNGQTATRLFAAAMMVEWRKRTEELNSDLTTLIRNLNDILIVDDEHSDEAMSPKHLSDSLGTDDDELDAEAMSAILSESPHAERLPGRRRQRVHDTLQTLRRMRPVFDSSVPKDGDAPFSVQDFASSCSAARKEYEKRAQATVDFFKSVRVARMETSNGYREAVHDPFFERFDMTCLTDDELRLFPPVLVRLTAEAIRDGESDSLLEILGMGMPVKVLITLEDLCAATDGSSVRVGWPARVPSLAMALNHAYALQAPISDFSAVASGLIAGCRFEGPALFGVYTGEGQLPPGYSSYIVSAAATESRTIPVIHFDPGAGETLAERMSVAGNPQHETDWPTGSLRYRAADDEEKTAELVFTPADFLFFDPRLRHHFWTVDPSRWHDDMIPLAEYIELAPEEVSTKIPYILAVDENLLLARVVTTREVVSEVLRQRSVWRNVQELGGINNSFAVQMVAREKQRFEDEKKQDIKAIEQKYVEQLDQDIGELTREIVERIAGRLILDEGIDGTVPPMPSARAGVLPAQTERPAEETAAPAVEEAPEAPQVVADDDDDDDDMGGLDDPYIDTPLCTTCNECTQLNGQIFAYNENKQAFVKDAAGGPFKDLVRAAELCPVHIIHPGKPKNPDEADLDEWLKRAAPFS